MLHGIVTGKASTGVVMRCDLHVHTIHSGMCTIPVASRFCRECYSHPEDVYDKLKRSGMALVTVTDHDSIGAAESLRSYSDFFLSEEVTCRMPSGTELHVGVYDITDRDHIELQRRRGDLPSLLAYLQEKELFFSVNHVLSSLTGRRNLEDFRWFEERFPVFEGRNGAVPSRTNRNAVRLGRRMRKRLIGGSDAHTLLDAGGTWTEVKGARSKREYFSGLRHGAGRMGGESGSYLKLTAGILQICYEMMKEKPWTILLGPLAAAVPLATLINYVMEAEFSGRWLRRVAKARGRVPGKTSEWVLQAQSEVTL